MDDSLTKTDINNLTPEQDIFALQITLCLFPLRAKILYIQDIYTVQLPYNNNDSIKDIVGVSQVVEGAKCCDFEDHLQGKQAGEDDVADLQNISELVWLKAQNDK